MIDQVMRWVVAHEMELKIAGGLTLAGALIAIRAWWNGAFDQGDQLSSASAIEPSIDIVELLNNDVEQAREYVFDFPKLLRKPALLKAILDRDDLESWAAGVAEKLKYRLDNTNIVSAGDRLAARSTLIRAAIDAESSDQEALVREYNKLSDQLKSLGDSRGGQIYVQAIVRHIYHEREESVIQWPSANGNDGYSEWTDSWNEPIYGWRLVSRAEAAKISIQVSSSALSANVPDAAMVNEVVQWVQSHPVLSVVGVIVSASIARQMILSFLRRNYGPWVSAEALILNQVGKGYSHFITISLIKEVADLMAQGKRFKVVGFDREEEVKEGYMGDNGSIMGAENNFLSISTRRVPSGIEIIVAKDDPGLKDAAQKDGRVELFRLPENVQVVRHEVVVGFPDQPVYFAPTLGVEVHVDPHNNTFYYSAKTTDDKAQNGGIDIKNIDVAKTGTARIQFNDQAVRDVLANGFNGFTPVILNITPVKDPLMALGVVPGV
jgi:hypothetical protein